MLIHFLSFRTIYRPVQLVMYLKNDLIEAVILDPSLIPIPGYLGKIKRGLKEKYQTLIQESAVAPDFLVIHGSPSLNDSTL